MYHSDRPHSGFRWWPFLLLFLLFVPMLFSRSHGFIVWPLLCIAPFFFWFAGGGHRHHWGRHWEDHAGWGDEKPKRKNDDLDQDEKPKRDSDSGIYYV